MSLNVQTQAVKDAIALFGSKVRDISVKADNAPNAQKLEGLTLNQVVELIAGTTGLTIQEVQDQLNTHIARTDNPHSVTAGQVGLGLVDNFATATEAEAIGTVFTYTATSGQTVLTGADDSAATMDLSARPGVFVESGTGDRLVEGTDYTINYSTSEITLLTAATAGTVYNVRTVVANRFIVTDKMWSALENFWADKIGSSPAALNTIQELAAALENNPDVIQNLTDQIATKATQSDIDTSISAITKTDIGLGSVEDYGIATKAEATGVEYSYTATAGQTAFSGADDATNTLDFVSGAELVVEKNGAAASFVTDAATNTVTLNTAAAAGDVISIKVFDNDAYMTPAASKAHSDAVEAGLQSQLNAKTDQTDHDALQTQVDSLTKSDVGLGSVDNFATATNADATAATPVATLFMTPASTKAATDALKAILEGQITLKASQADLDTLSARVDSLETSNAGLDQVENLAVATEAEAVGTDFNYTATAGQTAFSGADSATNTLAFEADSGIAVDVNGGTVAFTVDVATQTVTLATAAAAGDVVNIKVATDKAYMTPARVLDVRKEIDSEMVTALSEIEAAFNAAIADIDGGTAA